MYAPLTRSCSLFFILLWLQSFRQTWVLHGKFILLAAALESGLLGHLDIHFSWIGFTVSQVTIVGRRCLHPWVQAVRFQFMPFPVCNSLILFPAQFSFKGNKSGFLVLDYRETQLGDHSHFHIYFSPAS
jgi:hypothetical protein